MKKKTLIANIAVAAMTALTILSVLACGDDGESSTGNCCLNGSYYECPSADDAGMCSLDDGPGNCTRDSSKDDECS